MLLDVFTTERAAGQSLAVVLKADGLLDDRMQAIAAEFNLSRDGVHPEGTVRAPHRGCAHLHSDRGTPLRRPPDGWRRCRATDCRNRSTAVRLEEKVGVITCVIERVEKDVGLARFALLGLPEEVGKVPSGEIAIAATLGLHAGRYWLRTLPAGPVSRPVWPAYLHAGRAMA